MQSIKRLPRSVHSPLRSSIVLFDLPKVVEELIYNSIDAGATKVYVSINIRACYVKVEDDGCGITRDGLVMLGEKYVTSKFGLMDDIESISKSLGFRGEALGSLSDISLVEVRTKARGKPNAYRKILKGPKCLFFGIDDRREVVGTTVIVRELFYNQPVRRRCMQSSPKKVLHSVKKCVLRTALVHPQILFKVTDIESEDVLLCTIPSSSPLPLISDGFGNEVSSSLHEIVYSDKKLMLSGYISGSADAFSTKAFQYLYINSRFVSKCPIHKLVNDLAARFQGSLAQRVEPEFHRGKRLKNHGYPAYMFNLCCPPLSYDLSFEPSKTIIEFKEWGTILIFFEQAIMHCWEQLQAKSLQGKSFAYKNGISMENEVQKEGYSTIMEEKDEFFNSLRNSYSEIYPDESWAKNRSDHEYCSSPKKDMHYGHLSDETTFGDVCLLDNLNHETSWLFSDSINVKRTDGYSKFRVHPVHNHDKGVESSLHEQGFRNHVLPQAHKVRSRRSSSAPPFYKGKCKFFTLNCLAKTARKKPDFEFSKASPESINSLDNVSQSNASQKPLNREVSQPQIRQCIDEKRSRQEMKISYSVGSITDEPEHVAAEMTKWRTGILQPTVKDGDFWHNSFEQSEDILDISSGILHLAGSSLVPESIDKDCLQDARVLLQLDRKFIPVMASGTLIIIDQHAADERIRLEELRRKVLSGEGIGITYLDPEQELVCLSDYPFLMQPVSMFTYFWYFDIDCLLPLFVYRCQVLPEMGLQLLQKYREQIQQWGWICSTPSQPSESFTKNMNLFKRRACGVSLVAVPCILGINLTDKDLIEFIEQLVETDGSSTLPPSVLHVLNFKSCRGAIMFGDSLLPSECSLIVEELKATPLCFQCAHGRPTTVPLLNMAALHEQLAWLQVQQEGPRETWHGLSRHKSSIRRAQLRLDSARKFHSR
ncbi:DNA mismatch repair protein MLH3 isoform X7 [Phoenix dactylifera]|uniref:DNA mismatch repair protein MLH3 isoform X7 n=1 Tax=Phoenix dactylifera TaxID=42345 RepID=A0A8B8ZGQ6_PHODC|nr:DNA mismatch repair protein MLH3 isoform X7 [Phoenix dactylifera]